jgi:cell division protein FtsX
MMEEYKPSHRSGWRTVAMIAITACASTAVTGYSVGRNSVTKDDLVKMRSEVMVYVDDSIRGLREKQKEQTEVLTNIQGQIGNVRESQGRIDGKLDVIIPQLQNIRNK